MEKPGPKTWRDYITPAIAGSFLYVLAIVIVMSLLPRESRLVYMAVVIPVIMIATAICLGSHTHTRGWWSLWGREISLRVAVTYVGISAALLLATRLLSQVLMRHLYSEQLAGFRFALFRWPDASLPVFRSVVGSPIAEELLFRGWLMSWLREQDLAPVRLGKYPIDAPNFLTSLCFATIHVLNGGSVGTLVASVVSVFLISLLLGKARNESGGILVPMLCHAVINFINHAVLVPIPA